jgi:hypothetical protein
VEAAHALPADDMMLDGEAVVLRQDGEALLWAQAALRLYPVTNQLALGAGRFDAQPVEGTANMVDRLV